VLDKLDVLIADLKNALKLLDLKLAEKLMGDIKKKAGSFDDKRVKEKMAEADTIFSEIKNLNKEYNDSINAADKAGDSATQLEYLKKAYNIKPAKVLDSRIREREACLKKKNGADGALKKKQWAEAISLYNDAMLLALDAEKAYLKKQIEIAEKRLGNGNVKKLLAELDGEIRKRNWEKAKTLLADIDKLGAEKEKLAPYRWRLDIESMVEVPAGTFKMGSAGGAEDEKPVHEVKLPAFLIGKYEVTNLQFREFIEAGGYKESKYWKNGGWQWKEKNEITAPCFWNDPVWNNDKRPVVGISWFEAAAYAEWAGKRLPTEAEWERAARGAGGKIYPWGSAYLKDYANTGAECTSQVGSFPSGRNLNGSLDMIGNVWEWCSDWYSAEYYTKSPPDSPSGPSRGLIYTGEAGTSQARKVLRGGSFMEPPGNVNACTRKARKPEDRRFEFVGFRCAKDK
jgi:formylglycine-generating enzyme required for sulfatase activity